MPTLLITGGAGFTAVHTLWCCWRPATAGVLDDFPTALQSAARVAELAGRQSRRIAEVIEGDIADPAALGGPSAAACRSTAVISISPPQGRGGMVADPLRYWMSMSAATSGCLMAMAKAAAARFVFKQQRPPLRPAGNGAHPGNGARCDRSIPMATAKAAPSGCWAMWRAAKTAGASPAALISIRWAPTPVAAIAEDPAAPSNQSLSFLTQGGGWGGGPISRSSAMLAHRDGTWRARLHPT